MADGNGAYDLAESRRVAEVLEGLGFRWLEETLPPDDYRAYAPLAAELSIPLAGGEILESAGDAAPSSPGGDDASDAGCRCGRACLLPGGCRRVRRLRYSGRRPRQRKSTKTKVRWPTQSRWSERLSVKCCLSATPLTSADISCTSPWG